MAKAAPNIASGRSFHNVSADKWTSFSQLALAFNEPGVGHNQPPDVIDPIEGLKARLIETHSDLPARFRDLGLACGRLPDPIMTEADAAAVTDFTAQCRLQLRHAEAVRKQEKALFLRAGRAADAFFKGRSEGLRVALVPTVMRLKAGRLPASGLLEPTRIRGNYGTTASVRRSWTFEIVDLDQVPREYMSLDVPIVRSAISQDGIRHISGLKIFQTEGLRVRARTSPPNHKASSQPEQPVETSQSADAAKHRSSDQKPQSPRTPKRSGRIGAFDPRLKPVWADQKVLRYYRQALASLQPHDAPEIAKFRAANADIEARLWRKLPQCMDEIEFLYGGSRVSPEAGEGTPK